MLEALDVLAPGLIVALTNDAASPLAARATVVVDCLAGPETAVPASKSVTSTAAILLWAAAVWLLERASPLHPSPLVLARASLPAMVSTPAFR